MPPLDKGTKSKKKKKRGVESFSVRQLGGRGGGMVTYRTAPHLLVIFAHRCDQKGSKLPLHVEYVDWEAE